MKKPVPKKVNSIFWIVFAIGCIAGFIGAFLEGTAILMIGMVAMLCSVILRVIYYRCPHCGKYLDRSTGEYCPCCGKEVNR